MRKVVVFGISTVVAMLLGSGCSSVTTAKIDKNVAYTVQFSGNDFNVGEVVTSEMPYKADNPNMQTLLLNKALTEHKCDTILLPRYEIISGALGKKTIKITGRAATFKTR